MSAIWMRARSELRSRLGAVVALAVIVGVIGGIVIAAAAGARRTESAYPRLLQAKHALDVVVDVTAGDRAVGQRVLGEIERFPQVAVYSHVEVAQGELKIPGRGTPGNVFPLVSSDGRFGTTINGAKILEGRMYDPSAPDEIVPSFAVADDLGLNVGETVRLVAGGFLTGGSAPGSSPPAPVPLHVVGIAAVPGMFQPLAGGYLPGVLVSPGFYPAHPDFLDPHDFTAAFRLRNGHADLESFAEEVRSLRPHLPPVPVQPVAADRRSPAGHPDPGRLTVGAGRAGGPRRHRHLRPGPGPPGLPGVGRVPDTSLAGRLPVATVRARDDPGRGGRPSGRRGGGRGRRVAVSAHADRGGAHRRAASGLRGGRRRCGHRRHRGGPAGRTPRGDPGVARGDGGRDRAG